MPVRFSQAPFAVQKELVGAKSADPFNPGIIMGLGPVFQKNPQLRQAVGAIAPRGTGNSPVLLVEPKQMPWIFGHESELEFVKTLAGMAMQTIHHHGKMLVDGLWLVYGGAKLLHDWKRPDRDTGACVFKIGGLAASFAELMGDVNPSLAIPNDLGKTVNFVFTSAGKLYEGKPLQMDEMMLSADESAAFPMKLMNYFGHAVDPNPLYRGITAEIIPGLQGKGPA